MLANVCNIRSIYTRYVPFETNCFSKNTTVHSILEWYDWHSNVNSFWTGFQLHSFKHNVTTFGVDGSVIFSRFPADNPNSKVARKIYNELTQIVKKIFVFNVENKIKLICSINQIYVRGSLHFKRFLVITAVPRGNLFCQRQFYIIILF